MKGQKPKYPASLFWSGVAINILQSFFWLALSTVLLIIGIKTPSCAWAGLTLLAAVLVIAVGKQLIYRHTLLHSDTPEMTDIQNAALSPEWKDNVIAMVERAMNDEIEIPDEDEDGEDSEDDEAGEDGE